MSDVVPPAWRLTHRQILVVFSGLMAGEPHGYSLPPQTRPSSRVETPATSSAAPTKSISWSWRAKGRRSTELVITSAAIPIGTLT